jgi:hypothetical protein
MYKENGRSEPNNKREKANTKGKTFVCSNCGQEKLILNVEFGVANNCSECGTIMMEKNV